MARGDGGRQRYQWPFCIPKETNLYTSFSRTLFPPSFNGRWKSYQKKGCFRRTTGFTVKDGSTWIERISQAWQLILLFFLFWLPSLSFLNNQINYQRVRMRVLIYTNFSDKYLRFFLYFPHLSPLRVCLCVWRGLVCFPPQRSLLSGRVEVRCLRFANHFLLFHPAVLKPNGNLALGKVSGRRNPSPLLFGNELAGGVLFL